MSGTGTSHSSPPKKKLKQCQLNFFRGKPSRADPSAESSTSAIFAPSDASASSSAITALHGAAASSSCSNFQIQPNQPSFTFKRDHNNRSFQDQWYKRWNWLDWNEGLERVLCFPCRMVSKVMGQNLFSKTGESAFVDTGFCNWKDATRCFIKHEMSKCHKESVSRWCAYCRGVNVANELSTLHSENQKISQSMLFKILSTVRYLCRQGLALRGHTSESGNLQLLLDLRCEDDPQLRTWLERKKSFVSHDIQNEYMKLMAHQVSREILSKIRAATYYSIIADEVTDQTRQHQLGISLRWVDEQFLVHEDFFALCHLGKGDAETITTMIKDFMCRCSLTITNCRGQCYDGASVMAGNVSGVSTRIAEEEPRALFIHCLAHSLNLALQESARKWPTYRDMLDYVRDIISLIRASPKRSALFQDFQAKCGPSSVTSLRPLCLTRWTTREQSIHSILENYSVVLDTLSDIAESDTSDAGTKANGLRKCMMGFSFYFALKTALIVFQRTEQLSKVLQSKSISVQAALRAAEQTRLNVQHYRDEEAWHTMWSSCVYEAERLNLDPPTLPRVRSRPARFQEGGPQSTYDGVEQYHRVLFFQLLDHVLEAMIDRFNQPGLQFHATIEETILSSANRQGLLPEDDASIEAICKHFGSDLDERRLRLNLEMLHDLMDGKAATTLSDVTDKIKELGPARRLYAEVSKLITLFLVVPATSATAERSFSCLRRLKTYLRSTMAQERLNHVMLLHVHQEETDMMDIKSVAREFVALNDSRRNVFGQI